MSILGSIAGGLLGAGASIGGSALSYHKQKALQDSQNAFNNYESSTVYQRGTKDLLAAGLNPILAAGGQVDPSASAAPAPQAPNYGDKAVQGIQASLGLQSAKAQIDNQKAQNRLLNAQAFQTATATNLAKAQIARSRQDYRLNEPRAQVNDQISDDYRRYPTVLRLTSGSEHVKNGASTLGAIGSSASSFIPWSKFFK